MMNSKNRGYSLVEVLIAIAITGVVLLTVVTLFFMGKRNVYSGKQQTYAVSVATRVLEDLSTLTANNVLTDFTITDATALSTVGPIQGVSYANSFTRDTGTCTANGTPPPAFTCTGDAAGVYFLSNWNALIDPTKLQNATIGLIFTPTAPTVVANPWTTATYIKIRTYIQWDEAQRRRIAYFDTTVVNRQQ